MSEEEKGFVPGRGWGQQDRLIEQILASRTGSGSGGSGGDYAEASLSNSIANLLKAPGGRGYLGSMLLLPSASPARSVNNNPMRLGADILGTNKSQYSPEAQQQRIGLELLMKQLNQKSSSPLKGGSMADLMRDRNSFAQESQAREESRASEMFARNLAAKQQQMAEQAQAEQLKQAMEQLALQRQEQGRRESASRAQIANANAQNRRREQVMQMLGGFLRGL